LSTAFDPTEKSDFDHVFYSGPIDAWFNHVYGRLSYRTLDFEIMRGEGDYQGNAVINYCDLDTPYTRITEHKHLAPWEPHEKTICYVEYSRLCEEGDNPMYPLRPIGKMQGLEKYEELSKREGNVTFVGRLGQYQYLDMDIAVDHALRISEQYLKGFI